MSIGGQIRADMARRLREAGLEVCFAWERTALAALSGPMAVIGTVQTKSEEGALWNYLGMEGPDDQGLCAERYGRRFSAELSVDIYAPRGQAEELEIALQRVEELAAEPLEGGVAIGAIRRDEIQSDPVSRYLKCRCTLSCAAYVTVVRDEEGALLSDFILKGVVQ